VASRGSGHSTLRVLLYLDLSYRQYRREGRIRATMMTVMALLLGLVPMMVGAETGADTMKRLAAPMIGGIVTTYVLALLIYPVVL